MPYLIWQVMGKRAKYLSNVVETDIIYQEAWTYIFEIKLKPIKIQATYDKGKKNSTWMPLLQIIQYKLTNHLYLNSSHKHGFDMFTIQVYQKHK